MRLVVLGDVHANLAALEAVLDALRALAPDAVVCTGDVVGYNAEPAECIDLIRDRCDVVVAGNHDADIAGDRRSSGTNDVARAVQQWSRARLDEPRLQWLAALPAKHDDDAWMLRHGAFLGGDPTIGYVTGTMLDENLRAIASARRVRLAFCGHTHVPLIGWLAGGECVESAVRPDAPVTWPARADAVLVNPGAVGQPRDHDPRASFAVVDLERRTATWHRVAYDIDRTALAIARAGLPLAIAARLREGR